MFGRIFLILAQVSILTGVLMYNSDNSRDSPLGVVNIIVFFASLLIIEIIYQIYRFRKPRPFPVPTDTMTCDEFNR
jgi:membrane protein YdbS with pleckstrin-like domain